MTGHMDGLLAPTVEPWVTKQTLAEHLLVTRRWIEQQQHHGLPYLRMGSMNRYRISEVEEWLHERYGQGGETADAD
jgi:hypothetical protein